MRLLLILQKCLKLSLEEKLDQIQLTSAPISEMQIHNHPIYIYQISGEKLPQILKMSFDNEEKVIINLPISCEYAAIHQENVHFSTPKNEGLLANDFEVDLASIFLLFENKQEDALLQYFTRICLTKTLKYWVEQIFELSTLLTINGKDLTSQQCSLLLKILICLGMPFVMHSKSDENKSSSFRLWCSSCTSEFNLSIKQNYEKLFDFIIFNSIEEINDLKEIFKIAWDSIKISDEGINMLIDIKKLFSLFTVSYIENSPPLSKSTNQANLKNIEFISNVNEIISCINFFQNNSSKIELLFISRNVLKARRVYDRLCINKPVYETKSALHNRYVMNNITSTEFEKNYNIQQNYREIEKWILNPFSYFICIWDSPLSDIFITLHSKEYESLYEFIFSKSLNEIESLGELIEIFQTNLLSNQNAISLFKIFITFMSSLKKILNSFLYQDKSCISELLDLPESGIFDYHIDLLKLEKFKTNILQNLKAYYKNKDPLYNMITLTQIYQFSRIRHIKINLPPLTEDNADTISMQINKIKSQIIILDEFLNSPTMQNEDLLRFNIISTYISLWNSNMRDLYALIFDNKNKDMLSFIFYQIDSRFYDEQVITSKAGLDLQIEGTQIKQMIEIASLLKAMACNETNAINEIKKIIPNINNSDKIFVNWIKNAQNIIEKYQKKRNLTSLINFQKLLKSKVAYSKMREFKDKAKHIYKDMSYIHNKYIEMIPNMIKNYIANYKTKGIDFVDIERSILIPYSYYIDFWNSKICDLFLEINMNENLYHFIYSHSIDEISSLEEAFKLPPLNIQKTVAEKYVKYLINYKKIVLSFLLQNNKNVPFQLLENSSNKTLQNLGAEMYKSMHLIANEELNNNLNFAYGLWQLKNITDKESSVKFDIENADYLKTHKYNYSYIIQICQSIQQKNCQKTVVDLYYQVIKSIALRSAEAYNILFNLFGINLELLKAIYAISDLDNQSVAMAGNFAQKMKIDSTTICTCLLIKSLIRAMLYNDIKSFDLLNIDDLSDNSISFKSVKKRINDFIENYSKSDAIQSLNNFITIYKLNFSVQSISSIEAYLKIQSNFYSKYSIIPNQLANFITIYNLYKEFDYSIYKKQILERYSDYISLMISPLFDVFMLLCDNIELCKSIWSHQIDDIKTIGLPLKNKIKFKKISNFEEYISIVITLKKIVNSFLLENNNDIISLYKDNTKDKIQSFYQFASNIKIQIHKLLPQKEVQEDAMLYNFDLLYLISTFTVAVEHMKIISPIIEKGYSEHYVRKDYPQCNIQEFQVALAAEPHNYESIKVAFDKVETYLKLWDSSAFAIMEKFVNSSDLFKYLCSTDNEEYKKAMEFIYFHPCKEISEVDFSMCIEIKALINKMIYNDSQYIVINKMIYNDSKYLDAILEVERISWENKIYSFILKYTELNNLKLLQNIKALYKAYRILNELELFHNNKSNKFLDVYKNCIHPQPDIWHDLYKVTNLINYSLFSIEDAYNNINLFQEYLDIWSTVMEIVIPEVNYNMELYKFIYIHTIKELEELESFTSQKINEMNKYPSLCNMLLPIKHVMNIFLYKQSQESVKYLKSKVVEFKKKGLN